ncbi:MAG: SpoIIE family protein phosphatase [Myxococcota bacterium]
MLSWLRAPRTSSADRARSLAVPPVEELEPVDAAATFLARGRETKGALPVVADTLEGAVYSSRGRGYATYNEDAALLLRGSEDVLWMAAFDQAGGLGGEIRGDGSGLAAERVARALRAPQAETPLLERLTDALTDAHQLLLSRQEGEVTTAVVARLEGDGRIQLATSGDSGALLFGAEGELLAMNELHVALGPENIGCLTHALGLEPEGPDILTTEWRLPAGGALLLCSDGLLDSGLDYADIGRALTARGNLVDHVNALCAKILRRMSFYRSKPDNLTVVAARTKPSES